MNTKIIFMLAISCALNATEQKNSSATSPAFQQQQAQQRLRHQQQSSSSASSTRAAAPQQIAGAGAGWSLNGMLSAVTEQASALAAGASALATSVKDKTTTLVDTATPKSVRHQVMTALNNGEFAKRTDTAQKEVEYLDAINYTTKKINLSFQTDPVTGRSGTQLEHNRLRELLILLQNGKRNGMRPSDVSKDNIQQSLEPIRALLAQIDEHLKPATTAESKTETTAS